MKTSLMKRLNSIFAEDISKRAYHICLFVLIAGKLIASLFQMTWINVDAVIDDAHLFNAARSISEGNWLGAYDWQTLSKNMFFSVWLWLLNTLHIPYLVGGQLLFLAGCMTMLKAFDGYLLKSRVSKLVVFCFIWFTPYSWAACSLRVYRDNILPSLCLLFFSALIGLCLRFREKNAKKLPFAAAAGAGLALCHLTREDAIWVFPFAICAALFCIVFCAAANRGFKGFLRALAAPAVMCAVFAMFVCGFSLMNYRYYGWFGVSTHTSPGFSRAISLMISLDDDLPHRGKTICKATREKIAAEVPLMAEFCETLDNGSYYHGFSCKFDETESDFGSSGYFWMYKKAAYDMGRADSPDAEDAFWSELADGIQAAIDDGRLEPHHVSLLTRVSPFIFPYDPSFAVPTAAEFFNSMRVLLCFEQNSSLPELSLATDEERELWEGYTHSVYSNAYAVAHTDEMDVFFPAAIIEAVYTVILWIYRLVIFPLLAYSLYLTTKKSARGLKQLVRERKPNTDLMLAILLIGLLLTALVRIVLVAYIEYTSFVIGTYLMYLSAAGIVLFILFSAGLSHVCETLCKRTSDSTKTADFPE